MRFVSIIKKNFKLLIRSKSSAFTVLIGPLLIILLVGLVFSGKASYELSVGYYTPQKNNLTVSFVQAMENSNLFVMEFNTEQACVRKIEQGIIHTCIVFPQNFQIANDASQELKFMVDYSRMNLVYKIIDSVSGILKAESQELSYSLTQVLLSRINMTLQELDEDVKLLDQVNPQINLVVLDLQRAKTNTETMKLDMKDISTSSLDSKMNTLNDTIKELKEHSIKLLNETEDLIDQLSGYISGNESAELEEDFEKLKNDTLDLENQTNEDMTEVMKSVSRFSSSLSDLEEDLENSKQLNQDTKTKIDAAKNNLARIQSDLIDIRNNLLKTKQSLQSIGVTRAETIVSPVNAKIEPIVLESSQLTFTFPYLLMLVIMFVALLLSSTLIIFEKNSKAFFRNAITPTRPFLFVMATFMTSMVVIVLQTIIILGLANYFLQIPLFKNAVITLLVILITTAFFIVIGMAVGYLFSTQEGAIMSSIILGALFMFLSNMVVPLESIAPAFAGIVKYNPYVLASELLRKSLLFVIDMKEAGITLIILLVATIIIFSLMVFLHALSSRKRIKALPKQVLNDVREPAKIISKKKSQSTQNHSPVKDEQEKLDEKETDKLGGKAKLLKIVSNMTKAEFEDYVGRKYNKIADVLEKKYSDKHVAAKLRKTTSRKEILELLQEAVKKELKQKKG